MDAENSPQEAAEPQVNLPDDAPQHVDQVQTLEPAEPAAGAQVQETPGLQHLGGQDQAQVAQEVAQEVTALAPQPNSHKRRRGRSFPLSRVSGGLRDRSTLSSRLSVVRSNLGTNPPTEPPSSCANSFWGVKPLEPVNKLNVTHLLAAQEE